MKLRQSGSRTPWNHLFRDLLLVFRMAQYAVPFVEKHRLWKGLNSYKWLSKVMLFVGVLFGVLFLSALIDSFDLPDTQQLGVAQAVGGVFTNLFGDLREMFISGSMKYVILVLIEVVIFHFVRGTLIIITKSDIDTSFKTFLKAQTRMIYVVVYAWFAEMILSLIAKIPFQLYDSPILEESTMFLIKAFFTGFVIVDNYNEVYHMKIQQSMDYAWQYAGITISVGAMVYVILYVPFVGTIAGPLLGAVIATMALNAVHNADKNMDWVFLSKRKRKKAVKA